MSFLATKSGGKLQIVKTVVVSPSHQNLYLSYQIQTGKIFTKNYDFTPNLIFHKSSKKSKILGEANFLDFRYTRQETAGFILQFFKIFFIKKGYLFQMRNFS